MGRKVRVKPAAGLTILGLLFFVLIGFTSGKQGSKQVKDIVVQIDKNNNNYFIDQMEIMDLINAESEGYVQTLTIRELNLKELERRVRAHSFVKDVQIYTDIKGNLIAEIIQTRPIARIFNPAGKDNYISEDGKILPVSGKHTARVPLITLKKKEILNHENLFASEDGKKLYEFIKFVDQNEFWSAQVAHILIDEVFEASILTQVSKQVVEFGELEDVEEKFGKLKLFYRQILPGEGWNKYDSVSVKFREQIVAE